MTLTTNETTIVFTDWDLYFHIMHGWKVVGQSPHSEFAWWKLERVQLTDEGRAAIISPTPPAADPAE